MIFGSLTEGDGLTSPPPRRKFSKGRESWGKYLDAKVETDGDATLREILYKVARATGVRPEILFASAMEEGMQARKVGPGKYKPRLDPDGKIRFSKDENGAYIDGYSDFGLDYIGDRLPQLAKEGYLKKAITWTPLKDEDQEGLSEADIRAGKTRKFHSAFFNSLEDVLYAKAAELLKTREEVVKQASKRGLNLSDDAMDFITMQAYNGGVGMLPKILDKYKSLGLLDGEKFLTTEPAGGYSNNQTYYNTRKRYDPAKDLIEDGLFDDYYRIIKPKAGKPIGVAGIGLSGGLLQ